MKSELNPAQHRQLGGFARPCLTADVRQRMKLLLTVLLVIAGFANVCSASDDSLARGVPGVYTRQTSGMYLETLSLNADGSYLFTFHFDIGSDQEKGTWTVRDSNLFLSPKMHGKIVKAWPNLFRILTVENDLVLSVVEVATETQPEDSPSRLFRKEKKGEQTTKEQRAGFDLNRMLHLRSAFLVVQKGSLHARPRVSHR